MKNTTIISIHRLPYAAILAFLVQNPPVAIVENELHTASNQLIPRHPEQYRLDQRQTDIDDQQNLQDFLRPVAEIILGHGRKLDARQAHLGRSHRRQDDQNEHHNAHAAQPMGRGSPEKKPPRQRLHIAQAGRSGRRKARNGLEPCVRNRKLAPPKHIREHAGQTRHQPCPDDDRIALLAGDLSAARNEYQRESA